VRQIKDLPGGFNASLLGVGRGTGSLRRCYQGCVEAPPPASLSSTEPANLLPGYPYTRSPGLALGGYLFNRSESRRTKDDAERQRIADRQIADQRAQVEAVQAYLDQMSQLLLEKDLRKSDDDSEVRTLARARTSTVIQRLDADHNQNVVRFLDEAGLAGRGESSISLLAGAGLRGADLQGTILREFDLRKANLDGANLSSAASPTVTTAAIRSAAPATRCVLLLSSGIVC
jgi:pentapeptide repeat protein